MEVRIKRLKTFNVPFLSSRRSITLLGGSQKSLIFHDYVDYVDYVDYMVKPIQNLKTQLGNGLYHPFLARLMMVFLIGFTNITAMENPPCVDFPSLKRPSNEGISSWFCHLADRLSRKKRAQNRKGFKDAVVIDFEEPGVIKQLWV